MSKIESFIDEATGANDHSLWRGRPYDGQPWTRNGARGATEIKGITFRDLRDCFIRAICQSAFDVAPALYEESQKGERAALCENDLYGIDLNQLDIMAVNQNLSCEVERAMGIFPNVEPLQDIEKLIDELPACDLDGNPV